MKRTSVLESQYAALIPEITTKVKGIYDKVKTKKDAETIPTIVGHVLNQYGFASGDQRTLLFKAVCREFAFRSGQHRAAVAAHARSANQLQLFQAS